VSSVDDVVIAFGTARDQSTLDRRPEGHEYRDALRPRSLALDR
jgi:hypothetical protein